MKIMEYAIVECLACDTLVASRKCIVRLTLEETASHWQIEILRTIKGRTGSNKWCTVNTVHFFKPEIEELLLV